MVYFSLVKAATSELIKWKRQRSLRIKFLYIPYNIC